MSEYNTYVNRNEMTFNEYLAKVFSIMTIGLGITTAVAFLVSHFFETMLYAMGDLLIIAIIVAAVAEIVIAIVLGTRLTKLSKKTAWILFIAYSVLTGISLSGIFMEYTDASVWVCFGVTALMFGCMALIGHNTRIDMSKFSGLIRPALIAIIVGTILNALIFKSDFLSWIITYVGIVLFLGLIAYDMQMLRNYYNAGFNNSEMAEKLMIMGAFQLYLDFINLFIRILSLFGKRRSD